MVRLFIFIFLFVIIGSLATAITDDEFSELFTDQAENAVGKTLRFPVSIMFGDERMNIDLVTGSKTYQAHVITESSKIVTVSRGHIDDATLLITVQEHVVEDLQVAEDPLPVFLQALNDKSINAEAFNIGNKIKLAVAKGVTAVFGLFF